MDLFIGFILGAFFIQAVLPILQGFIDLFFVWIELKKSELGVSITYCNDEMREVNGETDQPGSACAAGFDMGNNAEYYDDDDEEIDSTPIGRNGRS